MLRSSTPQAKYCYERASKAKRRAFETADQQARDECLASEAQWLKLAANYEQSGRMTRFLQRPATMPEHPLCQQCKMSMWLVEMQSSLERRDFVYECKVCNAQQTITETND